MKRREKASGANGCRLAIHFCSYSFFFFFFCNLLFFSFSFFFFARRSFTIFIVVPIFFIFSSSSPQCEDILLLMRPIKDAFFHRLVVPCRDLNFSCLMVALSAGIIGGVFPVPLLTSIVTLIICRVLRCRALEATLATTVNLLLAPLELFLVVPFACMAAFVLGGDTSQFTTAAIYHSAKLGFFDFLQTSFSLLMYSCLCWMALAVPLLYFIRGLQNRGNVANYE
ncbi:hypothetical protein, conserved [Trypanosoma cruzi]|uniref:DUF2062 domain-containing protein n=1 Tax=Trypanosoma cruzi (strain CL Brener) TaxID=353153 RepID=Q4DVM3_TRYCC|nr:hypothetical protein, conserved [Trypanosoma cruzi]EAN96566.1 hypothetical protein, conserved [Trypanosoma cruzi]|eukprot:XP_818417.1 hypothetical protein [Trypanosoma cruzi strain CL Brener]